MDSREGVCEIHGTREIIKARAAACPSCGKPIVSIVLTEGESTTEDGGIVCTEEGYLAYPQGSVRPIPQEVLSDDKTVAEDYQQASLVLSLSPKASAALSRRCLQTILIKKANADPNAKLGPQIDSVLRSRNFAGIHQQES